MRDVLDVPRCPRCLRPWKPWAYRRPNTCSPARWAWWIRDAVDLAGQPVPFLASVRAVACIGGRFL